MDRRKFNKGTPGNKGGRKSKADELKLIETMEAVMVSSEVWQAVAKRVREGDTQAMRLWLAYRFGQPRQELQVQDTSEQIQIVLPHRQQNDSQ